jgi:hypothetical protein
MVLKKTNKHIHKKMCNPLQTPRRIQRPSRAPSNVNVESQTEHKFSDHSGLHSESKPPPEPEVKVRDETKEKERRARATEVINCQTDIVETLLPTVWQLFITHNYFYNESLRAQ